MELVLKGRRAFWWRIGAGASAPVPRSRTLPPARRCSRSDGASMACTILRLREGLSALAKLWRLSGRQAEGGA